MMTVSLHHELLKTEDSGETENGTCYKNNEDNNDGILQELFDSCSDKKQEALQNKLNNNEVMDLDAKYRRLLSFEEAPQYLAHNKFILSGYRGLLNTKLCIESIFWWTNETINIWSHIFGFVLFFALTVYDFLAINIHGTTSDKLVVGHVLLCFMVCMVLSSMYHTFSCRSEQDFHCFLTYDLLGIALSLLAIYISGIYFAFWCHPGLKNFYILTVTLIFIAAMTIQLPSFNFSSNVKMLVFVAWAAYGVVPTIHWTIELGGLDHPIVRLLLPRVLGMYLISGTAFFIYLAKIPERFYAGKFDYLGHSHQWWHIIIVIALYYWHASGILYVNYRVNHTCVDSMRVDLSL